MSDAPTATERDELFAFPGDERRTQRPVPGSRDATTIADGTHEGERGRLAYEPALDGLRGVAVMAVVLYHAGVSWLRGGYLGVDAFFVLSGFLITSLLVVEWRAAERIDRRAFWGRRARRLLPALFVCLFGFSLYCWLLASPLALGNYRADGLASLFYVMNWRLILTSQSYFDQFYASPLRHLWSLSIEEQWYLLWPVVVAVVLSRWRDLRVLFAVCAGGALASAALMAVLYRAGRDPSRLYYGTDTRAQSLLVGSALGVGAILWGHRMRAWAWLWPLAAVAVGLLAVAWSRTPPTSPLLYRGGFLLAALAVAVVLAACTQVGPNPLRAVLSVAALRAVGRISYGLYLYHWPLFFVITPERTGWALGSRRLLVARVGVSIVLATVSFLALERPVLRGRFSLPRAGRLGHWWPAPAGALVVLVALLASTAGAERLFVYDAGMQDPSRRPVPTVAEPAPANTAPPASRVLLVGDSVAYTYGLGFDRERSDAADVAVWNQGVLFCELVAGDRRTGTGEEFPASDRCADWPTTWARQVEQFTPEVAVLSLGPWEIFDRKIDGSWVEFGTPAYDTVLDTDLQRAVDVLSSRGAHVVLLTMPPIERNDPATPEWTPAGQVRIDHFNDRLRAVAAANPATTTVIDVAAWLCPDGTCRRLPDGQSFRPDGMHYSVPGATDVAGWLGPQLRALDPRLVASTTTTTTPVRPGS